MSLHLRGGAEILDRGPAALLEGRLRKAFGTPKDPDDPSNRGLPNPSPDGGPPRLRTPRAAPAGPPPPPPGFAGQPKTATAGAPPPRPPRGPFLVPHPLPPPFPSSPPGHRPRGDSGAPVRLSLMSPGTLALNAGAYAGANVAYYGAQNAFTRWHPGAAYHMAQEDAKTFDRKAAAKAKGTAPAPDTPAPEGGAAPAPEVPPEVPGESGFAARAGRAVGGAANAAQGAAGRVLGSIADGVKGAYTTARSILTDTPSSLVERAVSRFGTQAVRTVAQVGGGALAGQLILPAAVAAQRWWSGKPVTEQAIENATGSQSLGEMVARAGGSMAGDILGGMAGAALGGPTIVGMPAGVLAGATAGGVAGDALASSVYRWFEGNPPGRVKQRMSRMQQQGASEAADAIGDSVAGKILSSHVG